MSYDKNITVTIKLYGPFRRYNAAGEMKLNLWPGASLTDVRTAIAEEINRQQGNFVEHELLAQSIFAEDCTLLSANYIVNNTTELTILPPVCGG